MVSCDDSNMCRVTPVIMSKQSSDEKKPHAKPTEKHRKRKLEDEEEIQG